MPEFLLEVGCEEIPAGWLPGVTAELRERVSELAAAEHLKPESVAAHSTPRRLVVRADVLARQPEREEAVWGPSLKLAKDPSGNWTKAAEGFARKCGQPVETLKIAIKGSARGGTTSVGQPSEDLNLLFIKKAPGRPAADVIPGIVAATLRSLSFPKRMNWDAWLDDGKGVFPFGRPIRWLVALFEESVVPFTIYELVNGGKGSSIVVSGDRTRGHRFFPPDDQPVRKFGWTDEASGARSFNVSSFSDLRDKLRKGFVLLLREERVARIRQALERGLAREDNVVKGAPYLENHWADLVEYPSVVVGRVPAEFRQLPLEIVATVLVHHQQYIPIGPASSGVSGFAAITDTDGSRSEEIVRGMERVVVSRLRDASFFFQEDRRRPLLDRVEALAGILFNQKLGTHKEKTERIVELVYVMGAQMGLLSKAEAEAAQAAAQVCKADLTTLLVREFPELQGFMGGICLRAEGAPPIVAAAVQWHYHPLSIEADADPAGQFEGEGARVFAAVSIADKIDTLVGYFGIGEGPTGSRDPYALRRAAQGVIRVLIDFWRGDTAEARPNLGKLIRRAYAGYGKRLEKSVDQVCGALLLFFHERLVHFLQARDFSADEISAAVDPNPHGPGLFATEEERESAHPLNDPYACYLRVRALNRVRAQTPEDFAHLATAFKRARNILENTGPPQPVEVVLLEEPAERELYAAVDRLRRAEPNQGGALEARLRELATLRVPIDRFFDDVLVMAEDPKLRANRLGLLSSALSLFYRIADISKLGG